MSVYRINFDLLSENFTIPVYNAGKGRFSEFFCDISDKRPKYLFDKVTDKTRLKYIMMLKYPFVLLLNKSEHALA